ncbi:hypothetical protein JIR001_21750 [Polycladomyces abyssicola]|uniref:Uncharacterized protein n=1 Tax=Polycladomyces abyssicola TaxID=1125966 RepID=A0A8D5UFH8_9BACL|nr:hypothetical protein [Polycladomyces abyssicola]BCU82392.1 hypothetical protein JIR001_21750 [Polycladomyces abyssicola]
MIPSFWGKRSFLAVILTLGLAASLWPSRPDATVSVMSVPSRPPSSSAMIGDYGGEIREAKPRKDGIHHIDTPKMIQRLRELKVNTYFYLIWHEPTDWDDLRREFLPAAKKAGIQVWAYLVPPSEAMEKASEPFGTDYVAWFRAIGHLSRTFPNLKGVVIDDFNDNRGFFTPRYTERFWQAGKAENPDLLFYPQVYFPGITTDFIEEYHHTIDGVVMTFRDDKYRNTHRLQSLPGQVEQARRLLAPRGLPLVLMVHASKLSATPASPTVTYVDKAVRFGMDALRNQRIKGLITYVLHKVWFPEVKERLARSGTGYASVFVSPNNLTRTGTSAGFRQRIRLSPSSRYRFKFSYMSVYPDQVPLSQMIGQYQMQLWVDRQLVWRRDLVTQDRERWEDQTVDLTSYLKGKPSALITLCLTRIKNGPPAWIYMGFDRLKTEGFTLDNPDFESVKAWTAISTSPGMIPSMLRFDSGRRIRVYITVLRLYHAFDLYHRLRSEVHRPLIRELAERWMDSMVEGKREESIRQLEEMMRFLATESEFPPQVKLLLQCREMLHLLQVNEAPSVLDRSD